MPWHRGNRLRLIAENEAGGRTCEIYYEVKQRLGVPHIPAIFQAFAAYPAFLDMFWRAVVPALEAQHFFRLGDRLRAEAYTRVYNYFPVPDLVPAVRAPSLNGEARQAVSEIVDLYHYLDPLLLLLAAALMQAFEEPVGQICGDTLPGQHPVFFCRPSRVEEESASPQTKAIFDEMKHTLGVAALNTAYQAFARFPAFLESYWRALKPATQSPLYSLSSTGVRDAAWLLLGDFPARIELTPGCLSEACISDDDITAVMRIADLFVEALSRLVMNVALAKIGLEGGNLLLGAPSEGQVRGEPKQAA